MESRKNRELNMISVVMPTYNASKYVGLAIESVLNQTYPHFELIIVDDGSTDNTLKILESYAKNDSRIRILKTEHGGPSRARNLAIAEAKYSWVAILDADDIALPNRFEKQISLVKTKPNVVAWGSAVHHINSKGEILSISPLGPQSEAEFYKMRQEGHVVNLSHPSALLKKEIVLKVGGYNPLFQAAQDLELLDRMAEYGPILAIPEPLTLYRLHSDSISMNRFFLQRQSMRYVRYRHLAQLAGKPSPTFEEFLQQGQQQPWLKQLVKYFQTRGMFCYRKAGLFIGEKKYFTGSLYLALSILFNPEYTLRRIRGQVLSPKARKIIKNSTIQLIKND